MKDSLFHFRNRQIASSAVEKIKKLLESPQKIMHVCGTHEFTISRAGIRSLLPPSLELVSGPGCPVCVCPSKDIDIALFLAKNDVIITSFGDMLRVPTPQGSLMSIRGKGADIRLVYSPKDAADIAHTNPDKEVLFFSVGFETTAPTTASMILDKPPENFSILSSLRLVPPALELLVNVEDIAVNGFILPGHVSTIIGMKPYERFSDVYGVPQVIVGFEPLDVLIGIVMLLKQIKNNTPSVENEYSRIVSAEGNIKAQEVMNEVFEVVDASWRGIGIIPASGLALRKGYEEYDARKRYADLIPEFDSQDILPGCKCHLVILGKSRPIECPLFGKACTPHNPRGPCMVSEEGSCRISFEHEVVE
ncbi:MAG: hydrogenase formation protein HypD [Candidatus Hodarchaeota archaeon]